MGSEKFFVFNEAGTLKRLKGRIVRFLDNEEPDNDDKVAIRSSLSVPASAEGLTPANNLSDVSSAATSRANLEVNSIAEDAEATGTKLVGPSMRFDGSNDYVAIADDAKLSFAGSDDLPFSGGAWIKPANIDRFGIFSKWQGNNEYLFYTDSSNKLSLLLTDGANYVNVAATAAFTADEWQHVAFTYAGSGPNSSNAFSAAMNGVTLYINGKAIASTATNNASYSGMSDTDDAFWIGGYTSRYSEGEIRDVKLFNKELSAPEVKALCLSGSLPQIGAVLDARAEQFDTSTGKLYDLSGNDFVGTQSGGISVLGREFPVMKTGTWTPTVSFGGGSTGVAFSTQEGYYTRIGNQATVHGRMTLTSKGSSTGTFRIEGLPFTSKNTAGSLFSAAIGYSNNWDSSITETPSLVVEVNTTKLFATAAMSGSILSNTAIANSTDIRFSATYQIS